MESQGLDPLGDFPKAPCMGGEEVVKEDYIMGVISRTEHFQLFQHIGGRRLAVCAPGNSTEDAPEGAPAGTHDMKCAVFHIPEGAIGAGNLVNAGYGLPGCRYDRVPMTIMKDYALYRGEIPGEETAFLFPELQELEKGDFPLAHDTNIEAGRECRGKDTYVEAAEDEGNAMFFPDCRGAGTGPSVERRHGGYAHHVHAVQLELGRAVDYGDLEITIKVLFQV